MKNLVIREINVEDASDVGWIQSAITKDKDPIDFTKTIMAQSAGNQHAGFVAEVDGKVVGYMISYVLYGGFGLGKSAWITNFGVAPKFMGQGIGKSLAQEVLRVYEEMGIKHVFTSVRWDSTDLLSFFRTLGFDRSNFINLRKEFK